MEKSILFFIFSLYISSLFAQTINVSNATALQNALNVASAGQTIVLADGVYIRSAGFSVPANLHGTAANPIVLKGSANAILSSGNTNSGYSLGLNGNNYWRLEGFAVRGSKKGIVIDQSKYVSVKNIRCTQMGEEGIHLRTYSSFDTIRGCWIDSTGLVTPGYGEGLYVGSAVSNWATYTGGNPDTCNYNVLINNTFGNLVNAENIDIKEGTKNGWILYNNFNGAGLSNQNSADSWIDVKGNYYTINGNTGKNTILDGFQTHIEVAGNGNFNTFSKNILTVNNSLGYGINIKTSNANGTAPNNIVCNDNEVRTTPWGLTNIATTQCGGMERSMYVDDFDTVINSSVAKTNLLQYAQSKGITYLILYDLHTVHNQYNLTNAATNQILANFIADAKNNYGITKIAAAGENAWFFQNRIIAYNNTRSNPKEKFDVLGMEFEFWTPSLTNAGGSYCTDYLIPNGLSCDSIGAFSFCKSQLAQMRTMADASLHPMTVEMYIGWPNAGQIKIMAGLVDRMLVHAYVTNPSTSYTYALTRLQNYASINGMENMTIIFSAEPNFMGPWLNANSLQAAENTFLTAYNAASGTWKTHLNLQGFTYFTYSMMPSSPALPLQLIDFEGAIKNNVNILNWKIENVRSVKNFEIEKSEDGKHFEKIGTIPFSFEKIFSFEDKNTASSAYYRLKILDDDGRFDYSKIIFLEKKKTNEVQIFPNPVRNFLNISNYNPKNERDFEITNVLGQIVLKEKISSQNIDLQSLTKVIYFLKINNQTIRFVKE